MQSHRLTHGRRMFAHVARFVALPILAASALLSGCVVESRQHTASADMTPAPQFVPAQQAAPSQQAASPHAVAHMQSAPQAQPASSPQPAASPASTLLHPIHPAPATEQAIYVMVPPPAPRPEIVPPRPGWEYLWRPGHFGWTRTGYVWINGRWIRKPPRAIALVPGHWTQTSRGWLWSRPHFQVAGGLQGDFETHAVNED
jgi:hypothetical protein